MSQFPSQSHKSHEPREVAPVTRAQGRVRPAPFGRRLRQNFLHGDARSAWANGFWNSFIPGLADQLEMAMHEGLATIFGGTSTSYSRSRRPSAGSRISRHNPDGALGGNTQERITRDDRRRQDTGVVEIDSRAEAEQVLEQLLLSLDQFDEVTLAEFYQLVRITPDHTDYKFGWTELGGAKIVHSRGVYYLDLPPVSPLK